MNEGTTVWTGHEIQSGRAPIVSVDGKVPDALLNRPCGLVWVEVENALKNRGERAKVVKFSSSYLPKVNRLAELAADAKYAAAF
jgi:hypothetical protein